jgi:hypothetical protein
MYRPLIAKMIPAIARTTPKLNANPGSCAISASWRQVDEPYFREVSQEGCVSHFTLRERPAASNQCLAGVRCTAPEGVARRLFIELAAAPALRPLVTKGGGLNVK